MWVRRALRPRESQSYGGSLHGKRTVYRSIGWNWIFKIISLLISWKSFLLGGIILWIFKSLFSSMYFKMWKGHKWKWGTCSCTLELVFADIYSDWFNWFSVKNNEIQVHLNSDFITSHFPLTIISLQWILQSNILHLYSYTICIAYFML